MKAKITEITAGLKGMNLESIPEIRETKDWKLEDWIALHGVYPSRVASHRT
jgi:hypothetical protein